ncbi:MAG: hydroxymethylbilane synthase, partial [Chloroflexota bacterium]|nr:hydroxymethylbilane synthase [Chloroflexota bacterium]
MRSPVICGSRGSPLALHQTQQVLDRLQAGYAGVQFQLKVIRTEGDRDRRRPLSEMGGRGVFVRELETALLRKEIDMAVHSLKDLPTQTPPGLVLAAFSEREEFRDALVSPRWGCPLAELPPGASLGTGSPRRAAQLLAFRPDLKMVELRGNVDTRLRKAQDLDGIIVAAVGLERLGYQGSITQYLPPDMCLPAPGQGALAVEVRADDEDMKTLVSAADHLPTRQAVVAERAFLGALG